METEEVAQSMMAASELRRKASRGTTKTLADQNLDLVKCKHSSSWPVAKAGSTTQLKHIDEREQNRQGKTRQMRTIPALVVKY